MCTREITAFVLIGTITTLAIDCRVQGSTFLTNAAYILVYILEDVCVVCISTYAVNISLFVLSVVQSSLADRSTLADKVTDKKSK